MSAVTCANSSTTSGPPVTSSGSQNEDIGQQFAGHSQSHAIVYVVVILVLYFSILLVLICRYMRKERNQCRLPSYISGGLLKKDRYATRCARDLETSHLSTVSNQMMMDKDTNMPPTSALLPTSTNLAQMDTAV